MKIIYDWKIRRSGPNMTVIGKDVDGKFARATNIQLVEPDAFGNVFATDKDKTKHMLITVRK